MMTSVTRPFRTLVKTQLILDDWGPTGSPPTSDKI
jgi:hypothetical protein